MDKNGISCHWDIINNNSYQEIMFDTNQIDKGSYQYVNIPKEILPKFIITGYETIDTNFISSLLPKLEETYKIRNSL